MVEIGRLIDDHVDRWTDEWKEGGENRRMDEFRMQQQCNSPIYKKMNEQNLNINSRNRKQVRA